MEGPGNPARQGAPRQPKPPPAAGKGKPPHNPPSASPQGRAKGEGPRVAGEVREAGREPMGLQGVPQGGRQGGVEEAGSLEEAGQGAGSHRRAGLPPALRKEGDQALVKVLPQGHTGKPCNAQDLARPPRDAAAAAEARRGHLPRDRAEPLGRKDPDPGAEVLLVADGLQDQTPQDELNREGPPAGLNAEEVFLASPPLHVAVSVKEH